MTPDKRFMIMLKERIEYLEAELKHVKTKFALHESANNIHNATRYHFMKVCLIDNEIFGKEVINKTLDILFRNRVAFSPRFAAWKVINNTLEIVFAIQESLSVIVFRNYLEHESMTIKQHNGLDYALFKRMFFNDHETHNKVTPPIFHYLYQQDHKTMLEYWYSRTEGTCTDADLDGNMESSPFTASKNYKGSSSVQNQRHLVEEIYKNKMFDDMMDVNVQIDSTQ
jgi:hypothetical protein